MPTTQPIMLALLAASWPALAAGCATSADCSLLGDCATDRRCACDPGWTSPNCSVLSLAPARWGPQRQAYETNTSSWGGNVIQDPATKLYHLFFSEMRVGGLHDYREPGHCQLTTALSASPLGPFTRERRVLRSSASGPISHNVQPFVGGDGAIYIFFITSFPVTPDNNDTDLSVMVGRAETVSGPFEFVTPQLLDVDGAPIRKDNPSAIVYANGQPIPLPPPHLRPAA